VSVKKLFTALVLGYVSIALYYSAREAAGLLTCDCYPDCWCRKPGPQHLPVVFPRYHRNPGIDAWKEQHPEESR
jgi:hypothetical protein